LKQQAATHTVVISARKTGYRNQHRLQPVLYQRDNYGFSVPVVFRSKAQCEERLAVNVDKLTELAIITLIEH
jgi:hypothetical protein